MQQNSNTFILRKKKAMLPCKSTKPFKREAACTNYFHVNIFLRQINFIPSFSHLCNFFVISVCPTYNNVKKRKIECFLISFHSLINWIFCTFCMFSCYSRLLLAGEITVIAGNISKSSLEGVQRNVVSIISHARYNRQKFENDIAVLKVSSCFITHSFIITTFL